MPSYRTKPDRLEGLAAQRLLGALGTARQAVISAQTQVKVGGQSTMAARWLLLP
jgi:hypothetical protein